MTAEPNGSKPFIEFMKKVGIVAGAVLAVMAISNTLGGLIFSQAMAPVTREIVKQVTEEREARVAADQKLTASLMSMSNALSSDRLAILAVLEYPPGRERSRRIRLIREAWEQSGRREPWLEP